MAFIVTYHSLSRNNIRNLYSGLPEEYRLRTLSSPKSLTCQQRTSQQYYRANPRERFLSDRYYEFNYEYNARIPRAPAFRQLPQAEVEKLVERLSSPTVRERRRASDLCDREVRGSASERYRKCRALLAQPPATREKVEQITERLSVPTLSAAIRSSQRSLRDVTSPEQKIICEKYESVPSQRFAKEFRMYDI
ncbi:uncharacterized protein LOC127838074 [Dreissena polymorpha]|uniref:Uncharacterized protein n=1 Tax=Dreissena polymorpha TaxID=45954 RepID=A0A9D4J1T9_DREPO|nr:uncharacterized protein LOC127838074 [Dreissena polymorpha]KAH3795185.1 hypothetical protein DPMN_148733 [Dreissena polymorpha]